MSTQPSHPFASRLRLVLPILLTFCVFAPPADAGPREERAAKILSKVIGVPIQEADLELLDVRRTLGLPLHLPFIQKSWEKKGAQFLSVRVRDDRFTSAYFQLQGEKGKGLLGSEFIHAVGPASARVHGQTCTFRICSAGGTCDSMTISILWGNCPTDVCNSNEDCGGFGLTECRYRTCDPWGNCTLTEVPSTPGQPCPKDQCSGDSGCEATAKKKMCTVKRCDSFTGGCSETVIEVDESAPCPDDECSSNDECSTAEEGTLLDDILEIQTVPGGGI